MTALDERTEVGQHRADLDGLAAQLADITRERDQLRAALLDASDAADLASAARLDYWADGYWRGVEAGAEVGHGRAAYVEARCAEAHDTGWRTLTDLGGAYAELDRDRYPAHDGRPAGRAGWLTGNLGGTWAAWTEYDKQASYDGGQESEQ